MKNYVMTLLLTLLYSVAAFSQNGGDKIIGNYLVEYEGHQSKVKIFKYKDGYRVQNYWMKEPNHPDGTPVRDINNPDKSKRNTLMTEVVFVDKVIYKDGEWTDGQIYDPTSGKSYNVKMKFDDDKTLHLRAGVWGVYPKSIYWKKLQTATPEK